MISLARTIAIALLVSGMSTITSGQTDTTPPGVLITSPAANAAVSGSIEFRVTATDNVAVAGVRFFVDGVAIGSEDTTSPYSVSLNTGPLSNGTHTLTAIARDTAGLTATSAAVIVRVTQPVDRTAPTVSITFPAAGSRVSNVIEVRAQATDNVAVAGVRFHVDGQPIGAEDATAPYSTSLDTKTLSNGVHALTAVARDSSNQTATSSRTTIIVENRVTGGSPPAVRVTLPAQGAKVSGLTQLRAFATENANVAGLTFRIDGVATGPEDTSRPYTFVLDTTSLSNGTHAVTAVARYGSNLTATSDPVTITVENAGLSTITTDAIVIVQPRPNATVSGSIRVAANVPDRRRVAGVTFRVDGSAVGSEVAARPYSIALDTTKLTDGQHTLTAVLRDTANVTTISSPLMITVRNGMTDEIVTPNIAITNPQDKAIVSGRLVIGANTPNQSRVAGVTFFVDRVVIGAEDTTRPYSVTLDTSMLSNGTHSLTAVLRENSNVRSTSDPVTIVVRNTTAASEIVTPEIAITYPLPNAVVTGSIAVAANANSARVAGVTFYIDGVPAGPEDTSRPYSVRIDTSKLSVGAHVLTAVLRDRSDAVLKSAPVTIIVGTPSQAGLTAASIAITNPQPDAIASQSITIAANAIAGPTVAGLMFEVDGKPLSDIRTAAAAITNPQPNGIISGAIRVAVNVLNPSQVAGVTFRMDGAIIGAEDVTRPYSVALDTTQFVNGAHILTALVRDVTNSTTPASAVRVIVNNRGSNAASVPGIQDSKSSLGNAAATNTALIVAGIPTVARNDYVGWVGMRFTVKSAPVVVTELGRMFAPGNDGEHTLRLVQVSNGADVPGGSTPVTMSGGTTGEYRWAALTAPITLASNTSYCLVSSENIAEDGNSFYDVAPVTSTSVATVDEAVYWTGTTWAAAAGFGRSYGLVNLRNSTSSSGDGTPPTVSLTQTANAVVISGTAAFSADAADNTALSGVTFQIDGNAVAPEDTTAPYSVLVDTTGLANGTHTVTASARDTSGLTTVSSPISITVSNSLGDTTPPVVSISEPTPGASASGTIAVGAYATDNIAVADVTFRVNGSAIGPEDTSPPYSINLNTTTLPNGSHALTAVARDTSGQTTTSAIGNVNVNNPAPAGDPLIISTEPTTARRDLSGWVGMRISVGAAPLVISELGRMFVPGNDGTHAVKLVNVSNGADVEGGTAMVQMTGGTAGAFQWGTLAAPVTLAANTSYYVVSSENIDDLDDFYDASPVTLTSVAAVEQAVYWSGSAWLAGAGANRSYGPLNLRYSLSESDDGVAPTVVITQPSNAASVSGVTAVSADAMDNVAVAEVTFYVDGGPISAEDKSSPYGISLDTARLTNGSHSLTAVARDTSGLKTTSLPVAISVNHGSSDAIARDSAGLTTTSNPAPITAAADAASAGNPLILSSTPASPRIDYSGYVGMRITVGATALTVNELGRMFVAGNDGTHTLKLIQVSNGADVPGGTVDVSMVGGAAGQFKYAALASPVTLTPNTSYYVVSSENIDDIDAFFDISTVTAASVATVDQAVYWSGSAWVGVSGVNRSYGPLNLIYSAAGGGDGTPPAVTITQPSQGATVTGSITVGANATDNSGIAGVTFQVDGTTIGTEDTAAPYSVSLNTATLSNGSHTLTAIARDTSGLITTSAPINITVSNAAPASNPLVLSTILSNPRNDYGGWVGMRITIGPSPLTVSELARMVAPGNDGAHMVRLVQVADGADVPGGSVTISTAGATAGQFRWSPLAAPVTLAANTSYYLVSSENLDDLDDFYNISSVTAATVATINNAVYWSGTAWVAVGGVNRAYGPLNLRYSTSGGGGDTTPPLVAITAPTDGAVVSGTINYSANASDNIAVAGVTFRVDGAAVAPEDTAAPYTVPLTTTSLSNGAHTLTVVARDTSDLTTTSAPRTITVQNAAPAGSPLVLTATPTNPRDDYAGWVGMRITVGTAALSVSELARMHAPANSGIHTLRLVGVIDGVDVPGGSVSISMAGGTAGQFRWAPLAAPVILNANTSYYVVSSENIDAVDAFYDVSPITAASVAAVNSAVYWSGIAWVSTAGANRTYGPLNLRYTTVSGGDGTPPVVAITQPAAGAMVSGVINVAANASDNVGVAGVTFRVDGNAIGPEDIAAPYSTSLNTETLTNGTHTLTAIARDTSGLTTVSEPINISTSNPNALKKPMPLGDSITYGFVSDDSVNNEDGGYRRYLWETIIAGNHTNVNFVGSLQNGIATIDRDHEGHPGFRIDQLAAQFTVWSAAQPTIIMLMAGTNDLDQGVPAATALSRLGALIDQIFTDAPTARVIVSSIIPVRAGSWHTTITPAAINAYNGGIPNLVNQRAAQGKSISFLDMHALAALDTTITSPDYGSDGLHPSPTGYSKMASVWYSVLNPLL